MEVKDSNYEILLAPSLNVPANKKPLILAGTLRSVHLVVPKMASADGYPIGVNRP